ncbi:hypothetical protein [Chryseolinea lacunae]|uniref:Lycopene cyclase domain-containing protein n=1 Tax=Chryseolinea lacunae TaxID=2801331 RepID=A0ABS1KRD2_9BACT|nr:hypothetical protein [Chryseolinea lacunae]MBL0742035.1 hypothetical protein [Chryseolinea lacunae]
MKPSVQPWLADPVKESFLILAPAFVPVAVVILFQDYFIQHQQVSAVWWVVLVLCIDVSHVYSTLFRLYWDRPTFSKYKNLLLIIPVASFGIGFLLHLYDAAIFWRILAYVAVFHFVRQQYGFMRLYSRKENNNIAVRILDGVSIYAATLYPLLYWHLHLTGSLSWFVSGDFISIPLQGWDTALKTIYVVIIIAYSAKELWQSYRRRAFNIPKNLIMAGTYLSWYVGIVMFEGDLIFTLLNVVAHGVPYMGLIWIYGEQKAQSTFSFSWRGVAIFSGVLFAFAYVEETIWDVLVWKDHVGVFPFLTSLAPLENPVLLSIVVPLLVLPQITHYVLDGFIWRFSKDSTARLSSR